MNRYLRSWIVPAAVTAAIMLGSIVGSAIVNRAIGAELDELPIVKCARTVQPVGAVMRRVQAWKLRLAGLVDDQDPARILARGRELRIDANELAGELRPAIADVTAHCAVNRFVLGSMVYVEADLALLDAISATDGRVK